MEKETKEQIYERLCNEHHVSPEARLDGQSQREMIERLMKMEYERGFKDGKNGKRK